MKKVIAVDSSEDQDRQIVVESEHLPLVLGELGGQAEVQKHDARLGLTLIKLTDAGATGDKLEAERSTEFPLAKVPETYSDLDHLDRVLVNLRVLTEQRYNGWTPPMGKNRTLMGALFNPYAGGDRLLPYASAGIIRPAAGLVEPTPTEPLGEFKAAPRTHPRVRVGLLDTRIEQHSRFAGRYLADPNALTRPVTVEGRQWWEGHATFIAGIVLAQAPTADLDVRTALEPENDASNGWATPTWEFAQCLADYRDSGVAVLNLSLGCCTIDGKPPLVLERAIAQLTPNVVVIAAAGNHGTTKPHPETRTKQGLPEPTAPFFPAALDGVLAVGALDGGVPAEFNPKNGTDENEPAPWIDVFAEGVNVTSTYLGETDSKLVIMPGDCRRDDQTVLFRGWARWAGTSFAAAKITGAVAAEIADGRTPQEAVEIIRNKYSKS